MIRTALFTWYPYYVKRAVFSFVKNRAGFAYGIAVALLLYGAVWATFGGFARAGGPISSADRAIVLRSTLPVIEAIRRYQTDNTHPPATLAELVPKYLPRVPQPPMNICRGHDYLYAVEVKQWRIGVPVRDERDGVLTYSSSGDYPPGKPGMSVERIGEWAYYHGNPF